MRLLWSGGLVSVLAYLAVLYLLAKRAFALRLNEAGAATRPSRVLFLITGMSVYFSTAQFNLFTSIESNVPIYYVLWIVIGALYAGNAKPRAAVAVRPNAATVSLPLNHPGGLVA